MDKYIYCQLLKITESKTLNSAYTTTCAILIVMKRIHTDHYREGLAQACFLYLIRTRILVVDSMLNSWAQIFVHFGLDEIEGGC